MRYRYLLWQDKLLLLALVATFFAYSSYLRVAIRAELEGSAFQWAYFAGVMPDGSVAVVSGQGVHGCFDYVVTAAFVVTWLMWTGLRRPDSQFRAALFGWTSISSMAALWLTDKSTDRLSSGKETLGLTDMSHFWVEVLPTLVAWVLAVALLLRHHQPGADHKSVAWARPNSVCTIGGLACLGLAAAMLRIGPQHGLADFGGLV